MRNRTNFEKRELTQSNIASSSETRPFPANSTQQGIDLTLKVR